MAAGNTSDEDAKHERPSPAIAGRFDFSPWKDLKSIRLVTDPADESRRCCVGPLERGAAAVLLLALSPLMLLIAIAIMIDSPGGPILYRQVRVGLNRRTRKASPAEVTSDRRNLKGLGRPFEIYKFRTMIPNAEARTGAVWAKGNDPRATRVGKVLRHMRLDELPQLLNVVLGQMRLIGPRPERPQFVGKLCEEIPDYAGRQAVIPGITGLAQVELEYDGSVDDVRTKVKYDLYYVKHRSRLLDIKILMRTLDVMLRGRGAR